MNRMFTVKLVAVVSGLSLAGAAAGVAASNRSHDDVRRVHAGESIQAAVDAAKPGDTIVVDAGVYRENLTIQKDGITLRGAGSDRAVLQMPATPHPSPCTEDGRVEGICVAGVFTLGTGRLGAPVHDVRVSGLRVRDFTRFGVVVYNAVDSAVTDTDVSGSGLWGFAAITDRDVRLAHDSSHGNAQGGFYISDSPNAHAVLDDDTAYGNSKSEGIGIFVRDASHGVVRGSRLEGNCSGLIAVDSGEDGHTTDWSFQGNVVRNNDGACTPSDDIPLPLSGLGIALLGTRDTTVEGNRVDANAPTLDAPISGAIVVASATSVGGPDPAATIVRGNELTGNAPADLVYDGSGTGNRLEGNRCGTSAPQGLCR